MQPIDKIVINVRDSEITRAEFNSGNKALSVHVDRNDFTYTYYFYPRISTDSIKIRLKFQNILKVEEIGFYSRERPNVYFFVNDECGRTYGIYYGDYGGSSISQKYDLTTTVPATLFEESPNPVYESDFDGDSITNRGDNCPFVSNNDQKSICKNINSANKYYINFNSHQNRQPSCI